MTENSKKEGGFKKKGGKSQNKKTIWTKPGGKQKDPHKARVIQKQKPKDISCKNDQRAYANGGEGVLGKNFGENQLMGTHQGTHSCRSC